MFYFLLQWTILLALCLTKVQVISSLDTPWIHIDRNGRVAWLRLDLSARWRWVCSLIPWLYHQQRPPPGWYPLNKRLGEPWSWSGHFGGKKNLLVLPGYETLIMQPGPYLGTLRPWAQEILAPPPFVRIQLCSVKFPSTVNQFNNTCNSTRKMIFFLLWY